MKPRKERVVWSVALTAALVAVVTAELPPRPDWAEGIPAWGRLEVRRRESADLGRRLWERGTMVAQDARDRIYVLEPDTGRCTVYSPDGERLERFTPERWEPLPALPSLRGFAVDGNGSWFVAASRQTVVGFDRRRVRWRAALPTFVTGVALDGSDPVVARIPASLAPGGPEHARREDHLLVWIDEEGEIRSEAVPSERARGPDPLSVAFSQRVLVASDPGGDGLWVVDQTRRYRVRRLSSSGALRASWISDREVGPVRFAEEDGRLSEAAAERGLEGAAVRPVAAPELVRDVRARDGLLWVLARVAGGSVTVVDTFGADVDGPLQRVELVAPWPVRQLAVTDDGLWVFPVDGRGVPLYAERLPDWRLLELTAAAAAGRGSGSDRGE